MLLNSKHLRQHRGNIVFVDGLVFELIFSTSRKPVVLNVLDVTHPFDIGTQENLPVFQCKPDHLVHKLYANLKLGVALSYQRSCFTDEDGFVDSFIAHSLWLFLILLQIDAVAQEEGVKALVFDDSAQMSFELFNYSLNFSFLAILIILFAILPAQLLNLRQGQPAVQHGFCIAILQASFAPVAPLRLASIIPL